ncbi:TPA: DUF4062 domain-containing protein [Vibrio vulnificus]
MAIPKVFVSSTCYDLQEERAQLERFISGYGFQPILSEYSGVYYDVDTHTHESCVNEVTHCDLFVLIISGRYGGKYNNGNGESITQAEYNRAKELGLPIFTFVKADVFSAQHYYKANIRAKGEEFAKQITYPAIEKQDDAVSIFSFIESVSHASTNNGLEIYQSFSDIENHLKKQWAGMFFTFLKKRKEQENVENILSAIQRLVGTTSTLESLVESLHSSSIGEEQTKQVIKSSEIRNATFKFYEMLANAVATICVTQKMQLMPSKSSITNVEIERFAKHQVKESIEEYLRTNPLFFFEALQNPEDDEFQDPFGLGHIRLKENVLHRNFLGYQESNELRKYYESGIKHSDEALRKEAIKSAFEEYFLLS